MFILSNLTILQICSTVLAVHGANRSTTQINRHHSHQEVFHVRASLRDLRQNDSNYKYNFNHCSQLKPKYLEFVLGIPRGGGEYNGPIRPIQRKKVVHTRGGSSEDTTSSTTKSSSFFPIHLSELPHFLSMSLMMFLFIYVFTTVRDTKDTLVVSNCGAEAIPFLKLYGVMPSAFLFIMGYSRLSQMVGKKSLFYCTLIPFFLFYSIFAFVLFPNRQAIHFANPGMVNDGVGKAAYSIVQYWSYSLYFIVSELWASAGIPLLFWQVANDVTPLHQAKRFYPLFAVIGNLAPIVSGKVMSYIVSLQKTLDDVGFGLTLQRLAMIKIGICVGIITLYNAVYAMANKKRIEEESKSKKELKSKAIVTKSVVVNEGKVEIKLEVANKKKRKGKGTTASLTPVPKKKPTLSESVKELSKSKELKAMATMVFCYNACIELTEVLWKGILRKTYPNKADYMTYMANFSQKVGVITLMLQLSASTIIQKLGWKWAASLTPLTMVMLAIPFFLSVALTGNEGSGSYTKYASLATALTIGTWQNIVSKVTKYSFFDPCKEMAYIPLGPDAKINGKAAVDVLGARLGRSAGSATQQILVSTSLFGSNGTILNCAPYLGFVYVCTVGYWLKAVRVLGLLFATHSNNVEEKKRGKVDENGSGSKK